MRINNKHIKLKIMFRSYAFTRREALSLSPSFSFSLLLAMKKKEKKNIYNILKGNFLSFLAFLCLHISCLLRILCVCLYMYTYSHNIFEWYTANIAQKKTVKATMEKKRRFNGDAS